MTNLKVAYHLACSIHTKINFMSDDKNKKVEVTRETETEQDDAGNKTTTKEKITKEEKDVPEVKKKDHDVEVTEETTTETETHDED